jgi:hypothetical protein
MGRDPMRNSRFLSASRPPSPCPQTTNAQQRKWHKGLMQHTAASCFPSTNKARRREVDASGQGRTRQGLAQHRWQAVDAPRPHLDVLPISLPATREKPGGRGGGEILVCSARVTVPTRGLLPEWTVARSPTGRTSRVGCTASANSTASSSPRLLSRLS